MIKQLISIGGSSTGMIIDRQILELLDLGPGSYVELELADGALILKPSTQEKAKERAERFKAVRKHVLAKHGGTIRKLAKK